MIIFGSRGSKIADLDVKGTTCSHCGQSDTQKVHVYGRYFHIFWIPFLTIGKKVYSECSHCKKTIEEESFPKELKQQYDAQSQNVKRPLWHSLGCLGFVGIIGVNIILALGALIWGTTKEPDTRDALYRADLSKVVSTPSFESDSLSFKLKSSFDKMDASMLDPLTFEYFAKVENEKVLFLMKVPDLKKVPKEKREVVTNIVNKFLDRQEGLKGKKRYIGIHGKYNMMMVNTPDTQENGNLVASLPLLDFYGEKKTK